MSRVAMDVVLVGINVGCAVLPDNPAPGLNWFVAGFCAHALLLRLVGLWLQEGDE